MPPSAEYIPKQAKALIEGSKRVAVYSETGGTVVADFCAHNLTLIPRISSGSIIHDNACGPGTVTRQLLTNNPPSDLKIHATDIDQTFLDSFQCDAAQNKWDVSITNQRSEALSFGDNFFDYSINNIGIFFTTSGGLDGANEVFRTLKPGGTAIVNCWAHITWLPPFAMTHAAIRNFPMPKPPITWNDGQQIQKIMLEAGFKKENMQVKKSEAWATTTDLRDWAEKAWAFLANLGGWYEEDEGKWSQAVDLFVEKLLEQEGTERVGEQIRMRAEQWVVVATK
jgi:ubiquinone/menaquinone biosynthesis C-methylase UbiE